MEFFTLCRIAVFVTVGLALIDIGIDIACMLTFWGAIEFENSNTTFGLFHEYYLIGNQSRSIPWPTCTADGISNITFDPPRAATRSESVIIWIVVYLLLNIAWIVSSLIMEEGIPVLGSSSKRDKIPAYNTWALTTGVVLLYDLVAFIVFIIDVSVVKDAESCGATESFYENYLPATLVLPFYFIKGVVVWIGLIALLVILVIRGERMKKQKAKPTLFGDGNNLGRSLSQYQDSEIGSRGRGIEVIPQQQQQQQHLQLKTADERGVSDIDWTYPNKSFEPDYPVYEPPPPRLQQRQPPQQQQQPRRLQPRRISELSEMSEPRRIGHPAPALAADSDFAIPRAKGQQQQQMRAKPIRTPSGRSVKATEYLARDFGRDYYVPKEMVVREEDDDVERYFVKLKD